MKKLFSVLLTLALLLQTSVTVSFAQETPADNAEASSDQAEEGMASDEHDSDGMEMEEATDEAMDASDESTSSGRDLELVLDELVDEVVDEGLEIAELVNEDWVEGLVEETQGLDADLAATQLDEWEEEIQEELVKLERQAEKNPQERNQLKKKAHRLKLLRANLRAKVLKKHRIHDKVRKFRHQQNVYMIRWGVLNGKGAFSCGDLTPKQIRESLARGERPECDSNRVEYKGYMEVSEGELKVRKEVLFEKNDEVFKGEGDDISWDSVIAGHWDGLIVVYHPQKEAGGALEVEVSLGELNKTFKGDEILGRHDIGNGHKLEVKQLARGTQGADENIQGKVVENRVKVSGSVEKLREVTHRLRLLKKDDAELSELEGALDDINEGALDDETANEIVRVVNETAGLLNDGSTDADLRLRKENLLKNFKTVRAGLTDRKFRGGIIPFKDTDDDQWYTKYVGPIKARGIISGYKDSAGNDLGEYRPANNITVAELLKIGLEVAEHEKSDRVPGLQAALGHWAKGYVARAEELGLDITTNEVDLNRPATRAEVVRMMLEALGVRPEAVSATDFSDLAPGHRHAGFVQYAADLGIVSGDDKASTFRPDASINRAEVAKVANLVLETLLGEVAE